MFTKSENQRYGIGFYGERGVIGGENKIYKFCRFRLNHKISNDFDIIKNYNKFFMIVYVLL